MKRIGLFWLKNRDERAFSMTSRTSFTPLVTALSVKNGTSSLRAMMQARVVLPTPGGPQRIKLLTRPLSTILRSTAPGPTRCCCPI